MKILQINKYFYQKGGAETVFLNTIKLLDEAGNTVIPFCLHNKKNQSSQYDSFFVDYPELSESGFLTKIKNLPAFIYNKDAAKQLERLILHEKPDVAHIHLLFNSFSVSILPVLKKYKIPVVMTVHDYRLICPAYTITDGKGNVCEKCLKTKDYWHCIANKCSKGNLPNSILLSLDSYFRKYYFAPIDYIDHFIFVSHFSRQKHIDADIRFENKSSHVYNFTPVEATEPLEKEKYLLYFGRISEEKGILTLIKSVQAIGAVRLLIVGEGPLLDQLKCYESDQIQFLGFKTGDELRRCIQQALYVVVPSECYENNPMTIIEAMTLGTPVVGSRIGGIPELIEEGRTGFLFEPKSVDDLKDKLMQALSYADIEYNTLSQAAKTFAYDNFTPDIYTEKLMHIYNSLIEQKKR